MTLGVVRWLEFNFPMLYILNAVVGMYDPSGLMPAPTRCQLLCFYWSI